MWRRINFFRSPDGDGGGGDGGGTLLGGGGAGGDGGAGGGGGNPPADWRSSLAPEYRDLPALKDYKDLNGLVKSHLESQKLLGVDKIAKPQTTWKPEDWNNFWNGLGRPPEAKGYKVEGLEWAPGLDISEQDTGTFMSIFHEAGLTQSQVAAVMKGYNKWANDKHTSGVTLAKTNQETQMNALKQKWGDNFAAKVDAALAVIRNFGSDELKAHLNETGLGDNVFLIELFSSIGEKMGEDSAIGGGNNSFAGGGPAGAQAEIGRLKLDKDFMEALNTQHHPGHRTAVERWDALHKRAFPTNNVQAA